MSAVTAACLGLLACPICGLVCRRPGGTGAPQCPRCGTRLHSRKPDSLARTQALVVAAAILYIPANLLPVMHTHSLLIAQSDTILSSVIYLWSSGSWPLALLVFFASIVVPLLKLIALTFLTISVQRRWTWRPGQRARLYRLLEFVGRWSMLDIFVVTLLVALVQIQSLAVMSAGPGALFFAAVVVLTMFAAMAFDPRLIWDPVEAEEDRD
jgi:paraquat-inducible protein A